MGPKDCKDPIDSIDSIDSIVCTDSIDLKDALYAEFENSLSSSPLETIT